MFHFRFVKSSAEIAEKMKAKVTSLRLKVEERKGRIKALRAEHKITDTVYINLLEQAREAQKRNDMNRMSYTVKNDTPTKGMQENDELVIGAGVVNFLLTETDFMKSEDTQASRLELIARNLKDHKDDHGDTVGHQLAEEELVYLGF